MLRRARKTPRRSALALRVAYFETTVKDLNDFDPDLFLLVNRSQVESHGMELELGATLREGLEVTSHLTWVETAVQGRRDGLLNRPRWRGGFALDWRPTPGITVRGSLLHVGSVPDFAVPTGERTLDRYTRVDLALHWQRDERLGFYLQIDNLLDAGFEEAIGFPTPGVRPRIGVTWRGP